MRAGLLDEIVVIKRPQITKNQYGEKVQTYNYHYTTKARVVYNGGNRGVENGEILHNYDLTFEIWAYVDVVETDYITYDNADYRILSIEKDKHQMKKVIKCNKVNE